MNFKIGDEVKFRKHNKQFNAFFVDALANKYGVKLNETYKIALIRGNAMGGHEIILDGYGGLGWQQSWFDLAKTVGFVID